MLKKDERKNVKLQKAGNLETVENFMNIFFSGREFYISTFLYLFFVRFCFILYCHFDAVNI